MMPQHPSSALCERVREAVSAAADAEEPGLDQVTVDRHLRRCSPCRAYARLVSAQASTSALGTTASPAAPDLSSAVVARVARADRETSWGYVRVDQKSVV